MMFSSLSFLLCGILVPGMLAFTSAALAPSVGFFRLMRPRTFLRLLREQPEGRGTSPFAALSVALAGTLGVGNITGVASALLAGGPGAVFWMWVGALVVLPVKYAEVALAVRFRRREKNAWTGGAMYTIRDGLPSRGARPLAAFFALLCALNALVTGNLVQANAAVSVLPSGNRSLCGTLIGAAVLFSILWGTKKIEGIASAVIPVLCGVYIVVCAAVILPNLDLLPGILGDIVTCAFHPRAAVGGAGGFAVREAVRFGVMRGIFSNEAGCGTSPSAHAAAETRSPAHQGALGVVEVIFDTLILCTLTALVLLTADAKTGLLPWHTDTDAASVTLNAFGSTAGEAVVFLIRVSVLLFAYSGILAQYYYGVTAIRFLTERKTAVLLFGALTAACPAIGAVIPGETMWLLADLTLGTMTVINCSVLLPLGKTLRFSDCRRSPHRTASPR